MYEAFGLYLYKLNPELFKENVNYDMIEKGTIKTIAILESRMSLHERPNMAEELIRRDKALGIL